jgi:hypothetical protein
MKALLAACLWLLSAGAFAGGTPLFTPGPSIAASDPIRQIPETKQAGFVRIHPIVLNGAAFGADVVTVEVDGKVHTFAMHLRPRRQLSNGVDHAARWEGEEDDDSFTVRPNISLSKDDVNGELAASFFLPPRGMFSVRVEPNAPTLLIETDVDLDIHPRAPAWLIVGLFLVVGCFFAFGTAYFWQRVKSQRSATSRLARANAIIVGGTVLVSVLIFQCLNPEADWNPDHLDTAKLAGTLFFAAMGAGIVFWRVRAAYATGVVSLRRAASEGLLGGTLVFLCIFALACVYGALQGWGGPLDGWQTSGLEDYWQQYVKPGLIFLFIGAAVGIVLWAVNRYLLIRASGAPAPS